MPPLAGRRALVTGAGRRRGIGAATALELARQGADVLICDLARPLTDAERACDDTIVTDAAEMEAVAAEIEALGRRALVRRVDVREPDQASACVEDAVAELGGLDILFNNAGTNAGAGPFEQADPAQWEMSWRTNVLSIVWFTQAALPALRRSDAAAIVNNSSLSGVRAYTMVAPLTAAKFAVVGLSKAMALELGSDRIRVNAVCPGDIDTEMQDIYLRAAAAEEGTTPEAIAETLAEEVAIRRRGSADDVARVVAWLAGDASSYVNGEAIVIDGALPGGL